jgi:toxin ParE1/3/4
VQLVFVDPAARDLADIIDSIALDNLQAAEDVYRALMTSANRLCDFPEIGHPGRLPGTREWRVASLPYLLVYQVSADTVTIIAVFHGARDLPTALRERRNQLKQ